MGNGQWAVTTSFESKLPFTVEPKLPVEITAGDRMDVPVTVANDTDDLPINFRIAVEHAGQLNAFADGIFIREISLRHCTVDDGDAKRAFRIEFGKEAATQQRDAHCSEIVRAHRVVSGAALVA